MWRPLIRKWLPLCSKWLVVLSVAVFCGCAGTTLRHDYANYSNVYADSSNKQLLTNLAREQHDEPIYFIQLASISSEYQFNGSVGFSPSYVNNSPVVFQDEQSTTTGSTPPTGGNSVSTGFGSYIKDMLTLGGSVNGGFLQEPIYQFVPLAGSNFVQAILTPISDKVFLTFYDQGYPADNLARIMVESVQDRIITTNITYRITTNAVPVTLFRTNLEEFTNAISLSVIQTNLVVVNGNQIPLLITNPITVMLTNQVNVVEPARTILEAQSVTNVEMQYTTNVETMVNNPTDRSYPNFLEFCFFLRRLQAYHLLTVHPGETQGGTLVYQGTDAKLPDLASAVQSGLSTKYDANSGEYLVTKPDGIPSLQLSITNQTFDTFTNNNPDITTYTNNRPDVTGTKYTLALNRTMFNAMMGTASRLENDQARLKMKTVEVALYDTANEAHLFQSKTNLYRRSINYRDYDKYGTFGIVSVNTNYPPFAVRPVLTLNYPPSAFTNLTTSVQVAYEGRVYTIADFTERALAMQISNTNKPSGLAGVIMPENSPQTSNRDTFTVLSYLFSQVAIDTQKLPIQQLIQIQ